MKTTPSNHTLRLLFPQWQGGNNPPYVLGAQLLNWLAPDHQGPFEEVPVALDSDLSQQQGIVSRETVLEQARTAAQLIHKHNPQQIVILGGDCSVELAPMAYLNDRYDGDTALLWVDMHPDVSIPERSAHHHAHVLGNLLGVGDSEFVHEVPRLFQPDQILLVGLNDMIDDLDSEPMRPLHLDRIRPDELEQNHDAVVNWLNQRKPSKVLIHLDLDVLDMMQFRSLLVAYPGTYQENLERFPRGVQMETVIRVLQNVAAAYDVAGLGITEHFPWDALFLQNMLSRLPLIGDIHHKQQPDFHSL